LELKSHSRKEKLYPYTKRFFLRLVARGLDIDGEGRRDAKDEQELGIGKFDLSGI
jgi:hypothetical protein